MFPAVAARCVTSATPLAPTHARVLHLVVRVGPLIDEKLRHLQVAILGGHLEEGVAMVVHLVQVERLLKSRVVRGGVDESGMEEYKGSC